MGDIAVIILQYLIPNSTMAEFLKVHILVHEATHNNSPDAARAALALMDTYHTLHPQYMALLANINDSKFNHQWAMELEQQRPNTKDIMENSDSSSVDRETVFSQFKAGLHHAMILCDFHLAHFYLTRLEATAHFASHVTTLDAFNTNRYFEHLFYPLVTQLYGNMWFLNSSVSKDHSASYSTGSSSASGSHAAAAAAATASLLLAQAATGGTRNPSPPAAIEKKANAYFSRCQFLHPQVLLEDGDFRFYYLIKWTVAFMKFSQCRLLEYVSDFDTLQPHLSVLNDWGLFSQALLMYSVASIASKPFASLSLNSNEPLVDLFTVSDSETSIDFNLLTCMSHLAETDYAAAKAILSDSQTILSLNGSISFALPKQQQTRSSTNSNAPLEFWLALCLLIDQKAFLLIMSISEAIPRDKLLSLLGYRDCSPATADAVSNNLILVCSALCLGDLGVAYDVNSDMFTRRHVSPLEKIHRLQGSVDRLSRDVRAEASSAIISLLLMRSLP